MTFELLAIGVTIVVVDQATKAAVTTRLHEGESRHMAPGFRWRHVVNRHPPGARSVRGLLMSWAATMLLALLLASSLPDLHDRLAQASLGAALGGATGNALDRLVRQGVTDFIDVGFWPAFNLADVAIVGGAAGLVWRLL